MPLLLAVVGMPGSQKTGLSKKMLTSACIELSHEIARELLRSGSPLSPKYFIQKADELRSLYGPFVLLERAVSEVSNFEPEDLIIVDGLRTIEEWNWLNKRWEKSYLVAIHSSPESRYRRLLTESNTSRSSDDEKRPPKTLEECQELDRANLELGIGSLISLANYVVVNEDWFSPSAQVQLLNVISIIRGE